MAILTYNQLNIICIEATTSRPWYPPVYNSFLPDLYNTGCRPNELLKKANWTALSPSEIRLLPSKGNVYRYFNPAVLSTDLVNWITGASQLYDYCTYSKMKGIWNNNATSKQVFRDSKEMDLYCFRYRYVKGLKLAGHTDAEIQDIMGWNQIEMVNSYVNADLYT